mgnify:CR=1 FL=1
MEEEAIDIEFKKLPALYIMYDFQLKIPHLKFQIVNEFK